MGKLTERQRELLKDAATPAIATVGFNEMLLSRRDMTIARRLANLGLLERYRRGPLHFRITDAGRAALEGE